MSLPRGVRFRELHATHLTRLYLEQVTLQFYGKALTARDIGEHVCLSPVIGGRVTTLYLAGVRSAMQRIRRRHGELNVRMSTLAGMTRSVRGGAVLIEA